MNKTVSKTVNFCCVVVVASGCTIFDDGEKVVDGSVPVKRIESSPATGPDKGLLNLWFGLNEQPGQSNNRESLGVNVNGFLWRAALDTISFMPLAQADPFGGIILTDWYQPPDADQERFKINLYILGSELRADGLRASVFRQRKDARGFWVDGKVNLDTGINIENAILKRARQMRVRLR